MSLVKKHRVILYCRVSSDEQKNNTSLGFQEEYARDFCAKNGYVVDRVYREDHSAKSFDRPQFKEMITYAKRHRKSIDFVFFYDYSRFGRDTAGGFFWHNHLLKDLHITPQSLTQWINYDTPEYVYQLSIYLSGPQVENTWRSIKTRNGMIARMKEGKYVHGKLPIGYKRDRNTGSIYQEERAELIKKAFELASINVPVAEITHRIKALGLDRPLKSWYKTFRNTYYKGVITNVLLDEPVKAVGMTPIVSAELFDLVQNVLDGKAITHSYSNDEYPLKGFCSCGNCNNGITGYKVTKKRLASGTYIEKKTYQHYYICNTKGCRTNYSYRKMHNDFIQLLDSYTINEQLLPVYKDLLTETFHTLSSATQSNNSTTKRRLTEISNRLESLNYRFIDGHIDSEDYASMKKRLLHDKQECEKMLTPVVQLSNPCKVVSKALDYLSKTSQIWQESTLDGKVHMQNTMFPEGVIYDKQKRSYRTPVVNRIFELISANGAFKSRKASNLQVENTGFVTFGSPPFPQIEPLLKDLHGFLKLVG